MKNILLRLFNPIENEKIKTNFLFALLAQGVSFSASIIMALFIPKLLGIEEFGYWQLFLLYATYVGIFSLGANDGIYLRLGGSKFKELQYSTLRMQFAIFSGTQISIFIFLLLIFLRDNLNADRDLVVIGVIIFGIGANLFSWLGYLLQSTNLTHNYSIAVLLNKFLFVSVFLLSLFFESQHFFYYICIYILCQYASLIYLLVVTRSIFSAETEQIKTALSYLFLDIRSGIKVMLAYHAAALMLGIARLLVDANWGIKEFSFFSFAFSLTTFILLFLGQISLVIFPAFKRLSEEEKKNRYLQLRKLLYLLLPIAYLGYFPFSFLINWWLPHYAPSLLYFGVLLPIAIFDSKTSMLGTTFLKIYRDENMMLIINVVSLIFGTVLTFSAVYIFQNLVVLCIAVVISVILRTFLFELYLSFTRIKNKFLLIFVLETSLATSFVFAVILETKFAWLSFAGLLIVYFSLQYRKQQK